MMVITGNLRLCAYRAGDPALLCSFIETKIQFMADDDTALQSVIKNNAQTHLKKSTLWFLLKLYMLINMLHKQIRLIKKIHFGVQL